MSKALDLGSGFRVPIDILTSTVGILGIRGSGKTNTAGVIVEEATRAGVPSSVTDPTSAWWGIKSSADGKEPGLPFYVFGGEHADVPLEAEAGEVMARFAVEQRVPMILDLSLMTKGKQVHFMASYAAELYHKNREAFLQVIDETARFCPQTLYGRDVDAAKCVGAIEDLGALGRVRGLGLVIVGQRAAKINKNILTQCHTLIVHQTNSPQDRKAVDEWIGEQYGTGPERDRFLRELPHLKRGEAFVWSPTFEIFERVQIRQRTTFDSSKTPEIGKRVISPKVFAAVDLEALSVELQAAKERAEADDPRKLRAQIRELEARLSNAPALEVQTQIVETPLFSDTDRALLSNQVMAVGGLWERIRDQAEAVLAVIADCVKRIDAFDEHGVRKAHPEPEHVSRNSSDSRFQPPARSRPSANGETSLSKAERLILTVLAQFPQGRTTVQIAILTGYAVGGGGFRNALGSLNTKGYISRGAVTTITDAGRKALGPFDPLPSGPALLEHWLSQLSKAEAAALSAIANNYPRRVPVETVAKLAGYEASGGGFRNALGRLRTLELIDGRGELRASDALFEQARV